MSIINMILDILEDNGYTYTHLFMLSFDSDHTGFLSPDDLNSVVDSHLHKLQFSEGDDYFVFVDTRYVNEDSYSVYGFLNLKEITFPYKLDENHNPVISNDSYVFEFPAWKYGDSFILELQDE